MATLADFLARALPWPAAGEPGVASLHWRTWKGRQVTSSKTFTALGDMLSYIEWSLGAGNAFIRELYFCTSIQKGVGPLTTGDNPRPTANRVKENILHSKAFFADIDKGYETPAHALAAVAGMCAATQSPMPTAVVVSGNGLHVYWFSTVAFPPDEWRRYAGALENLLSRHGIHHDPVTTDITRILRPPGTFNNKGREDGLPPKPVVLKLLAPEDIDFAAWASLNAIKPPEITNLGMVPPRATISAADLFVNPADANVPPSKLITDSLKPEDWVGQTLDPTPVFQCPMFSHTLETHGAEVGQPLWNQQALACTFLTDGEAVFHELSKGHATYRHEDTEAMFARKVSERVKHKFGYPLCATFEREGSKRCATCPLRGTLKSPLSLRPVPAIGAAAALPTAKPAQEDNTERDKEEKTHPITAVMKLHQQGAGTAALFAVLNENYAVVRNGSEILVASIIGSDVVLMNAENFHKIFANVRIQQGDRSVEVSKLWFVWPKRRQYLDRGVVFEPGGPLDITDDKLNLWRGFGIEPKQGDWSLLGSHILNVLCSGRQDLCDYLLKWMAYAVQHPDKPIGVAVAFLGAQGTGKGIVARTFGKFFGRHFAHIANGDQLTGRFNWSIGTSCAVFLDEALWAGDKKGEGVLKALITEPSLNLEAKFRDPIKVENRLRIIVASNNDWAVPTGVGDRRWFVLNVANTYAGTIHQDYWTTLYAEIENGGAAAMLHDLLAMDLGGFDVRAVPHTAAKAQQQALGLHGTEAWLYHVLQEGEIGDERWQNTGLAASTDHAYNCYEDFSKRQHAWRPEIKAVWSKKVRSVLGQCVEDTRQTTGNQRVRSFKFAPLADCRRQFATHSGAPNIEWEADNEPESELSATPLKANAGTAADANPSSQSAPNKTAVSGWRETL